MKMLCAFVALGLVSGSAMAGDVGASAGPSVMVRRTTLMVANMERSLAFYRDVLGFSVDSAPRTLASGVSAYGIFNVPEGVALRFVTLSAGRGSEGGQGEILGLIEVPGYRADEQMRGVALVVKVRASLASLRARLAAAGGTLLPATLAGNKPEQGVLDPDGHLVALYEF